MNASIIVIGAGVAGLRAASLLQEAGLQVIVLEARDRIGGRTWTDRSMPGVALDLGASWIHGSVGNPLYDYSNDLGVVSEPWDYDSYRVFNADGTINAQISNDEDRFHQLLLDASKDVDQNQPLQALINSTRDAGDLDAFSNAEIAFLASVAFSNEYGLDASQLSIQAIAEDDLPFGDPEVVFPHGYDAVASALAENLEIVLNSPVTRIDYRASGSVTVQTNSRSYEATQVLVTVPLGVLKASAIDFLPPLPAAKTEAIDALEMGLLDKVYMRFEEPFWETELQNFGYISEQPGRFPYWLNLRPLTGEPLLMAFNGGSVATEVEALSDGEIIAEAMAALRSIYGNDSPDPVDYRITRWASDTFSYGAYSAMAVGATPDMRRDLAQPIDDRVFFAGEATHSDHPATVHGAFLSGEREAERILSSVKGATNQ